MLAARRSCLTLTRRGLSSLARPRAEGISAHWQGTSCTGGQTMNFIGGRFEESRADKWNDVHDPSTQTVLSRVPETTEEEFERAVAAAKTAFEGWRRTSVLTRQKFALE
jgi:malonate-semialdehyde dehydrogenase (acetylating)/methylmalonate-semialdehyde dehydrogenase